MTHIGITVSDSSKAAHFFKKCLGYHRPVCPFEMSGEWIDKLSGTKVGTVKISKLIPEREDYPVIELLQYTVGFRKTGMNCLNDLGTVHMAFHVENIEEVYGKVNLLCKTPHSEPMITPNKKAIIFFCRINHGIQIEFIQKLEK